MDCLSRRVLFFAAACVALLCAAAGAADEGTSSRLQAQLKDRKGLCLVIGGGGARVVPGGILDCTWTQSMNRRSRVAYAKGKVSADMMAWNADVFATVKDVRATKDGAILWRTAWSVARQAEAIVIAGSKVVFAGTDMRATPPRGFLAVRALADGERLDETWLDARPTLNGLAVARGRLHVSLYSGRLLCLGP